MKYHRLQCLAGFALSWIVILGATRAAAENEPGDNISSGASPLSFNTSKLASSSGNISGGDTDWYKVTNKGNYSSIQFTLSYTRTDTASAHALEILDGNLASVDFRWTDDADPLNTAIITISAPAPNAVYHVAVRGTAGATAAYTLRIQASGGTPQTQQTLWDYYYAQANSSYQYFAGRGDEKSGLAFWFYYRAYGDQALRNAQGNSALANKEFYLGLAYFYYTYLTGSSAIYYYYLYIGYSELTYYLALGDSATANVYYNFYYALALSVL